jgi:phosphoribosylglycinamide formyltransferase-1
MGTNLQALLDTVHEREAQVVAVASNTDEAPALARARERGVASEVFPRNGYRDREARDEALAEWLAQRGARLVVLAGYMEILGAPLLERFPGAVINVHPSLLPAFPGLRAIEQALEYGVKVFGVTVHFVDAGVDSGPVILQRSVELPDAGEPEEVLAALRPLEHTLLPEAVALIARGAVWADEGNPRRMLVDRAALRQGAG